jgi:hypothetical protein
MQLGADLVTGMQMVRQLRAVLVRSLTLLDCRGDRCRVEASTTATAPGQAEPAGGHRPHRLAMSVEGESTAGSGTAQR